MKLIHGLGQFRRSHMASIKGPEVAEIDEVNPMGTDGFEFVE